MSWERFVAIGNGNARMCIKILHNIFQLNVVSLKIKTP